MYIKVYVTPNSRKELVEKENTTTYRIKGIPSPINHPINLPKFRLQNFASVSPYLDMTRLPYRFSLEIMKGFNVGASIGEGMREPKERNLANVRLRQILAEEFSKEFGQVKLVSGHRSPTKAFDV